MSCCIAWCADAGARPSAPGALGLDATCGLVDLASRFRDLASGSGEQVRGGGCYEVNERARGKCKCMSCRLVRCADAGARPSAPDRGLVELASGFGDGGLGLGRAPACAGAQELAMRRLQARQVRPRHPLAFPLAGRISRSRHCTTTSAGRGALAQSKPVFTVRTDGRGMRPREVLATGEAVLQLAGDGSPRVVVGAECW